jgi:hypothetical protein
MGKATLYGTLTILFLATPVLSADRFEQLDTREISLPGKAVDLAVAADGTFTFVLTDHGEVAVYDAAGTRIQTMNVGSGYERLDYDSNGNRLVLGGSGQQELKVITLVMRYDIDTEASPYRGPQDAPVTIAVFNDFQ